MNLIVAPVPIETPSPTPQAANIGSGQAVSHGETIRGGQLPFSSVIAQTQTAGQKPPSANTSSVGKTSSTLNTIEDSGEIHPEQLTGDIPFFSSPGEQDTLLAFPSGPNFVAGIEVPSQQLGNEDENPVAIPVPGLAEKNPQGQFLSSNFSEEVPRSIESRSQSSDSPITNIGSHLNADIDSGREPGTGLSVPRPLTPTARQGLHESLPLSQEVDHERLQPIPEYSTTVSMRIRERIAGPANTPAVDFPDVLSIEGFTRQSQHVLSSYVNIPHSSPGGGGKGVDNGTGDIVAKLNARIENDGALKGELASPVPPGEDTGSQEFGLDRGSHQRGDLSPSQQRSTQLSSSGAAGVFVDLLGESSSRELGPTSRFGMVGERQVGLPSSLPQRLQMDVTLADHSRLQIDVAVQHRQVSAHLVTDQTFLRNLAVQHEGQLVGQLADAGLELKNFGAHIADHPAFGNRETRDELRDGPSDQDRQDGLNEDSSREFVLGMLIERGLHFVA